MFPDFFFMIFSSRSYLIIIVNQNELASGMGLICRLQSRLELVSWCPLLIGSPEETLLPRVKMVSLQLKEITVWDVSLRFKTGEWLLSSIFAIKIETEIPSEFS